MLVSITQAKYLTAYKIALEFDNGESGIVDLKQTIFNDHRKIFAPLREVHFFKPYQLDAWTITWPNNADFAPEFLYELAMKQMKETTD